jgi:NADPH:quinone reductase-like Zn-dependent oxidoreductase
MATLPLFMRAVALRSYDGHTTSLTVLKKPVPQPGNDEVLVRVSAAPINPSDMLFVRGRYGRHRPLPATPGMECSGVVVEAGGVAGELLTGRRVACMASAGEGTWAEYVLAHVGRCVPLRRQVGDEQGSMCFVGPLTAWALVQSLRKGRHRAGAQTAAASALGQVVLRLAQRDGIDMVHIVRRQEQVDLLEGLGAEYVLNSSLAGFDEQCRDLFARLGVRLAFDAVSGEMTGRLLAALPRGGRVTVFGTLSDEPCRVDPYQLIFEQKGLDGFWLDDWFPTGVDAGQTPMLQLSWLFEQERGVAIRSRYGIEQIHEAVEDVASGLGAGKVLLVMGGPGE